MKTYWDSLPKVLVHAIDPYLWGRQRIHDTFVIERWPLDWRVGDEFDAGPLSFNKKGVARPRSFAKHGSYWEITGRTVARDGTVSYEARRVLP